jgi:hypothetical protein
LSVDQGFIYRPADLIYQRSRKALGPSAGTKLESLMTTYLIIYDINKEGAAYSEANRRLIEKIKSLFSTWWHHLDSTWIVVTSLTAAQVRNALQPVLDSNDELLVVKSGEEGAWCGFSQAGSGWLKQNL